MRKDIVTEAGLKLVGAGYQPTWRNRQIRQGWGELIAFGTLMLLAVLWIAGKYH